jgi:hypothetical protein
MAMVDLNPIEGLDEDSGRHLRTSLFLLVLALIAVIGANLYLAQKDSADGVVSAIVPIDGTVEGQPAKLYAPQVTFRTEAGAEVVFVETAEAQIQAYQVMRGQVPVIYDPDDPWASAKIGDHNWLWVNVGVLLAGAAVWLFRGTLNMVFEGS